MASPKNRISKMRKRMRRSGQHRPMPTISTCSSCGEPSVPHRVCHACGQYAGRQVLTVSVDE